MKVGAVYPQIELKGDPAALDLIGRTVEALGYNHLLMYDHVLAASHADRDPPLLGPYTENDPFHEPLISFAYLAGITSRIEFFTGILILPQRQTALVAKQAADVDLLSGGRLNLGFGTGWNYVEYQALGVNYDNRGKLLDEQIDLLRRFWTEPQVQFEGRFHTVDRGGVLPRPGRSIPIYCGGTTDVAFRRAVKFADGFIFGGPIDQSIEAKERIGAMLAEAGRSPQTFSNHTLIMDARYKGLDIAGTIDALRRWQDAGGHAASVVTMGRGFSTADAHLDFLAEVRGRLDA